MIVYIEKININIIIQAKLLTLAFIFKIYQTDRFY